MPTPTSRVSANPPNSAQLTQDRANPSLRTTRATGSNRPLTHDELINDRDSPIHNVEDTAKFLASKGYLVEDITPSISAISYILLQIAATSKEKTFRELIRAISILIDQANTNISVDSIATAVEARLEQKLEERLASASKQWEQSAAGIAKLVHTQAPAPPRPQPVPVSYAAVTAQNAKSAATHNKAIYRTNLRSRQVIIDTDDESTRDLSEKEITVKARLALDTAQDILGYERDPDQQDGIKILGASKLKNGGIMLELESPAAVGFLTDEEVLPEFLAAFGGQASVKSRGFQCIAEFVPTSFSSSTPSSLRAVETDSRLQANTILKARWIKPVERRSPGQKVAHLFLDFDSPYTANRAIDNGIFIENKKVNVRKAKIEPKRCLKCQTIGARHIAISCPSPTDICGFCSGKHHTAECKSNDPHNHRCANCKQAGHMAWDKSCPEYKKQALLLDERCPENTFRLFPSDDDPLSWECIDNHAYTAHTPPDDARTSPTAERTLDQDIDPDQPTDGPIARGRMPRPRPSRSRASSRRSLSRTSSAIARPSSRLDGTLDSFLRKHTASQSNTPTLPDPHAR